MSTTRGYSKHHTLTLVWNLCGATISRTTNLELTAAKVGQSITQYTFNAQHGVPC